MSSHSRCHLLFKKTTPVSRIRKREEILSCRFYGARSSLPPPLSLLLCHLDLQDGIVRYHIPRCVSSRCPRRVSPPPLWRLLLLLFLLHRRRGNAAENPPLRPPATPAASLLPSLSLSLFASSFVSITLLQKEETDAQVFSLSNGPNQGWEREVRAYYIDQGSPLPSSVCCAESRSIAQY